MFGYKMIKIQKLRIQNNQGLSKTGTQKIYNNFYTFEAE